MRLALDDAPDPQLPRLAAAMLHPLVLLAFKEAGIPLDEAIEVVAESLIHHAARPSADAATTSSPS